MLIINKIFRKLKRPVDTILLKISPHLNKTGFFLQGQMDIHDRAYWLNAALRDSTGGFFPSRPGEKRQIIEVEPWDQVRRDMIVLLLRSIIERDITGDFGELGVWKGYTAKLLHYYAPERRLHLFDTFTGFDKRDVSAEKQRTGHQLDDRDFSDTSVRAVLEYIQPLRETIECYPGFFPESVPETIKKVTFSFVHLDADLYEPTKQGLSFFYPRMSSGGFILLHDYNAWPGVRKAADEFCLQENQIVVPFPDKSGSALIIKH